MLLRYCLRSIFQVRRALSFKFNCFIALYLLFSGLLNFIGLIFIWFLTKSDDVAILIKPVILYVALLFQKQL